MTKRPVVWPMMMLAKAGLAAGASALAVAASSWWLVVCSPGSPGTTQQAQPTMDLFAQEVSRAAGRPADSFGAVYHETTEAGLARLAKDDAAMAMVPLPFLLRYGKEASLQPKLEAVPGTGEPEIWSLVAKKGQVTGASSLAGWEVTGTPGYAEGFVRGTVLGGWGSLPPDAKVTFNARPLGALRRAATGENVAVLLDREQTTALASLPFASDLEVVTKSKPLPSGFLCLVDSRLPAPEADKLIKALLHLHQTDSGREILKTMKMTRFKDLDQPALDAIRRSAAGSK